MTFYYMCNECKHIEKRSEQAPIACPSCDDETLIEVEPPSDRELHDLFDDYLDKDMDTGDMIRFEEKDCGFQIDRAIRRSRAYNPRPGLWPDYVVRDNTLYAWVGLPPYRKLVSNHPVFRAGSWKYMMIPVRGVRNLKFRPVP